MLLPASCAPACLASHVQCNIEALAKVSHPVLLQKTEVAPFGKQKKVLVVQGPWFAHEQKRGADNTIHIT